MSRARKIINRFSEELVKDIINDIGRDIEKILKKVKVSYKTSSGAVSITYEIIKHPYSELLDLHLILEPILQKYAKKNKLDYIVINRDGYDVGSNDFAYRIKNTVMQNVVDKLLRVQYEGDFGIKSQSIILRSNNSFVIWIENEESDYGKSSYNKKVLDGFWDIRSLTKKSAKVRLLGKVFKISEEFEMYKNDKKSERVAIFSDILDVRKSSITGKKQMGKITY